MTRLYGLRQLLLVSRGLRHYSVVSSPTIKNGGTSPQLPRRSPIWKSMKYAGGIVFVGGVSFVGYGIYAYKTPQLQYRPDPNKKTLVVLGSGWASAAFLKNIDASKYNVVVISPRNYFLFTPLLPSCATGLLEVRSLIEPVRNILRRKPTTVTFYEATATKIDCEKRVVHIRRESDSVSEDIVAFDYLVNAVGTKTATFGIHGVEDNAHFLKEVEDAQKIRRRVVARVEEASLRNRTDAEIDRLLHMVIVGGGPTGVEVAAELQDFVNNDLKKWAPEMVDRIKITLVEALPTILPMFPKSLVEYAETVLQGESIALRKCALVRCVTDKYIEVQSRYHDDQIKTERIPYGLLVWAAGNAPWDVTNDLLAQIPEQALARRGVLVDEYLRIRGTTGIWAAGDCTETVNPPTAQVASQQGAYLANYLNSRAVIEDQFPLLQQAKLDEKLIMPGGFPAFKYDHKGSLAYVGNDRAIADLSVFGLRLHMAGAFTFIIWKAAYIEMCTSIRNRFYILGDWGRAHLFGRDVGEL